MVLLLSQTKNISPLSPTLVGEKEAFKTNYLARKDLKASASAASRGPAPKNTFRLTSLKDCYQEAKGMPLINTPSLGLEKLTPPIIPAA